MYSVPSSCEELARGYRLHIGSDLCNFEKFEKHYHSPVLQRIQTLMETTDIGAKVC